ncbi:RecQ family ATP-dependent DNA helicase [Maribacter sp. CXY002]|uniref:RecQ family ATP-dependent DNA helicase n=1 Tax=Maribacter luteocoastalis TaxID=3407671 RepID=UPI003B680496
MDHSPIAILKKYWGFTSFKKSQENIINTALDGRDVLGLLPTGGGKSICFQVPAMSKPGICIVISPLIALIQDQVSTLKSLGIKAIGLTGRLTYEDMGDLLDNCIYGNYKFLYISPERLEQEIVQERIRQMNVNLIVVDEAHCISQWGHDFRPAYLKCTILRELQPEPPIMALTATATSQVSKDIIEVLELIHPHVQKDSFLRNNIAFKVVFEEDKNYRLRQYCASLKTSGIVYTRTRRVTEQVSKYLLAHGISATHYHGGLSETEKKKKLEDWLHNKINIMVATNAFGMGIDKPDVSMVVHYQIPDCIENYFQEAGRVGRDGNYSEAILLTNKTDQEQVKRQFLSILPEVSFVKLVYGKLNSYFQIAYGELGEKNYQLNFNSFCATYHLNPLLTYNALRILDRNSVLALSEYAARKITVQFIVSKDQLFTYIENNRSLSNLIKIVLRTYGGIFEFETKINTVLLAKKLSTKEEFIITALEKLAKDDIISYKGFHSDMELTFLVPREDDRTIHSFAKNIKEQNTLKQAKVAQMVSYIKTDTICRSVQLLNYFGEENSTNCGICDVCLKNNQNNITPKNIKNKILSLLIEGPLSSREIESLIVLQQEEVVLILKEFLEDGKIKLNSRNQYEII